MKVIFLRHGRYEYNVKRIFNQDVKIKISLDDVGREQARKAGKILLGMGVDIIYSSEFQRVKETVEIVNESLKKKIIFDSDLNEYKSGNRFEGRAVKNYFDEAESDRFNFKTEDGESWNDLVIRARKFINKLRKTHYKCVLIVSHEWPILAMRQVILKLDNEIAIDFRVGNCQILEYDA